MKDCELVKLNLCLGCVGLAEKDWCGKEQCEKYKRFKESNKVTICKNILEGEQMKL